MPLIVSWNINGLNSTAEAVSHYILERQPDVLCLNEIKVGKSSLGKIFPKRFHPEVVDGYTVYWNPAERGGWHGVAVFVKKGHTSRLLANHLKPSGKGTPRYTECSWYEECRGHLTADKHRVEEWEVEKAHTKEGRLLSLAITFEGQEKEVAILATYVPNSGCDYRKPLRRLHYRTHHWDPDVFRYLAELSGEFEGRVLWCGDLNVAHHPIDVAAPAAFEGCSGFTLEERASFDTFLKTSPFYDVWRDHNPGVQDFSFYNIALDTRKSRRGWRLDYFIVHESLKPYIKGCRIDLPADQEYALKAGWTPPPPGTKPSKGKRFPRVSDHVPIDLNIEFK